MTFWRLRPNRSLRRFSAFTAFPGSLRTPRAVTQYAPPNPAPSSSTIVNTKKAGQMTGLF